MDTFHFPVRISMLSLDSNSLMSNIRKSPRQLNPMGSAIPKNMDTSVVAEIAVVVF